MLTKVLLFYSIILLSVETSYAEDVPSQLQSGLYGQSLRLAINEKEKVVTGYNSSAGGYLSGVGWDCNFYFSGRIKENAVVEIVATAIYVKNDEATTYATGRIRPVPNDDAVILKLMDEVSGCAGDEDFLSDQPAPRKFNTLDNLEPVEIRTRSNAFEYRLVKAKKSYFYGSGETTYHKKSYVVCGDMVLVRDKSKSIKRVKAQYIDERKTTEGWLNQEDLLEIGGTLSCPGDR